ncbi:hypothetical protein GA830_05395 [Mesorhizobium sp. NBSH29]|uniref:hypothetical protein n=1 Tax=Mesorhizobium sp. NBSH29 TaxID=2654249 RepID=UPI00189674E3|nr:hypothetical protein [Mesorhizobium sp. NBSH29]QPC86236.1 hypothetical protein GA830_05395 [Mesorhizobium sp. NBSH29]
MRFALLSFAAASLLCTGARAAETVDLKGLVAVPTKVRNSGDAPILCQAEIAHWFATDLVRIEPGATATLDLRFDTQSGAWAVLNAGGEALPLERAWCGVEGHTYETRFTLALDRSNPQPATLDCRPQAAGLSCSQNGL